MSPTTPPTPPEGWTDELARLRAQYDAVVRALEEQRAVLTAIQRRTEAAPAVGPPVYLGDGRVLSGHPVAPFMFVNGRDLLVAPYIMRGAYEPGVTAALQRLVRPDAVVVEGGANQGFHTITMAFRVRYGGGRVLAFEPEPRHHAVLTQNLRALGMAGCATAFPQALYHENTRLPLYVSEKVSGSNLVHDMGGGTVEVEAVRASDVLDRLGLRPDFVRLDVDGSEAQALDGMWDHLRDNARVVVMFEFCPFLFAKARYRTAAEFLARLAELGLRFWRVEYDGGLTPITPAEMTASVGPGGDWIEVVAARSLDA